MFCLTLVGFMSSRLRQISQCEAFTRFISLMSYPIYLAGVLYHVCMIYSCLFYRVCMDQVKKPATMSFIPLKDALVKPEPFMETDFAKIGRPGVLHQAFRGLDKVLFTRSVDPEPSFCCLTH